MTKPRIFFLALPARRVPSRVSGPRLSGCSARCRRGGRELYELQYGAEAKALLEQAVRSGDIEKLNEVGRRYFHTPAWQDATVLLGRLHFDRGRPLAAALCWNRVLESRPAPSATIRICRCPWRPLICVRNGQRKPSRRCAISALGCRRPGCVSSPSWQPCRRRPGAGLAGAPLQRRRASGHSVANLPMDDLSR